MVAFNIFKPDMVIDQQLVNYYLNKLANELGIRMTSAFYIHDWISIAQQIYEADVNCGDLCQEKKCARRRQLLTTIKAYEMYYPNRAVVALYDVKDLLTFNQLLELKRHIRQQHVYNTPKYYLKFLDETDIDFSLPLHQIDLSMIVAEPIIVPSDYDFSDPAFSMAFFNRLHLPDQDRIAGELTILEDNGVFGEENRMLRLSK